MATRPQFEFAPVSAAEYLSAERRADFKSEYYQGQVYAMAGAGNAHNLINLNLGTALNIALAQRDCTVRISDQRLLVKESGLYTYPDLSVVCGPAKFVPDKTPDTLLNPVLLAEVSSRSTTGYDRVGKFMLHKDLPTLRQYLLIEATKPLIRLATWQEPKVWAFDTFEGLEAVVPLTAIGVDLPLAAVYIKVPFAD